MPFVRLRNRLRAAFGRHNAPEPPPPPPPPPMPQMHVYIGSLRPNPGPEDFARAYIRRFHRRHAAVTLSTGRLVFFQHAERYIRQHQVFPLGPGFLPLENLLEIIWEQVVVRDPAARAFWDQASAEIVIALSLPDTNIPAIMGAQGMPHRVAEYTQQMRRAVDRAALPRRREQPARDAEQQAQEAEEIIQVQSQQDAPAEENEANTTAPQDGGEIEVYTPARQRHQPSSIYSRDIDGESHHLPTPVVAEAANAFLYLDLNRTPATTPSRSRRGLDQNPSDAFLAPPQPQQRDQSMYSITSSVWEEAQEANAGPSATIEVATVQRIARVRARVVGPRTPSRSPDARRHHPSPA